ncbi:NAD+--asparagine ADP-ribosyltransferase [Olsenella profusa DSM 13989]|nr:NAD+--asparagine ADP-ribosyltransferase [Olsenella profusa DSM 13989]
MIRETRSDMGLETNTRTPDSRLEKSGIDPDKLAESSEARWDDAKTVSFGDSPVEADKVAEPYLTTYEERLNQCAKEELFENPDMRGESMARPDLTTDTGQKAKERLAEYGQEGIWYRDALPDFGPVSECTVQIEDMTSKRAKNFDQADDLCAKKWSAEKREEKSDWTDKEVAQWRKDNSFSWHECADMKTMNLVSRDIHEYFSHSGGVAECQKREGIGGNEEFDE